MSTIMDKLNEYSESDFYGFHMPGHKRNPGLLESVNPYKIDITEIDGFDDLHHADGILKEAQKRAAKLYHAQETHFLINGSTSGILSAILGVTKKRDTVLVARNCHKSVYHAIYMNELNPVYLYPGFCPDAFLNTGIKACDVTSALDSHPEVKAVVIVSPTYDGVVSDVAAIAWAAHEKGIPLIVDEAHGAHFGFHSYFPDNSNLKQADIVIHSLHKTLPALTQSALLHMNGSIVERSKVRTYLHMLQTSSPSYVLMASIDSCMNLLENRREALFDPYVKMLESARKKISGLENLKLTQTGYFDRSKLVISAKDTGMTGRELYTILLENYHLQMEMAAGTYVLAMTSAGDVQSGMNRLTEALAEIDRKIGQTVTSAGADISFCGQLPRMMKVYSSAQMAGMAEEARGGLTVGGCLQKVPWSESAGCISTEYAYLYPPGCPLVVPGEKLSKEAADMLQWYKESGFSVEGPEEEGHIEVWIDG